MKTATLPLARTGAFALLLLVALPAAADNVNPAVTNGWVTPRPQYCNACSADCPVRPESPDPAASGGNPGSSGCPSCDDESPHAGVGSVSFWQRFGRTPLVAGAPLGRIEIREIGAARLPSGADVLRYNHPLMRRIVDRDDAAGVVAVEEGNGWIVVYRDGVPVGASSGADLEIRRDAATGLFVEQLEDRTRVFYNADNVVDHLVTPDGVRLDWDNAGLDVIWDGSALGQVRSVADGLMDVTRLSPSSFRVSWYPPAAVGDKENGRYVTTAPPAKTFTFSYEHAGGEHRLSLLEWRNETFHFNYLWKSRDGLDWTLVRDPDGLALSESVSSTDANGLRTSVRTWSDASGVLRRTSETYRHGANGATLVRTGVIETNGADVATWAASRFETGSAAGRLSSTTNQYGGATIYTYDTHGRLLTGSATVFGSLEEVTSYAYETNLVDGFVDRRPRRRTVARGGVVVSDTAYSHGFAPDGGRLDTVTRSDPVSGVSLVSSRLYYPASSTNAAEAGRLRLAVSEDRTATLYAYAPTANGGYVRTSTRGYIADPGASAPSADASRFAIAPSQSTRTVETVNFRGDVVRVDEFVHTGDGWSPAGWTTYAHNLAHRRTGFADHRGDHESSEWICTGPVWQDLADGTSVTNAFDRVKRLSASTHHTPFGAVTTAYAYNAVGEIVGTTVSTNGVAVRGTLAAYDARGRRILSVDEQGRTNTVAYSADNRTVTRTTQAGAITTTTYNTDGSVATVAGNVRPYETRTSGVDPATGLAWTEVRTAQDETSPSVLASRTFRNALGQTVRLETPAPNNLLRATLSSYDALGRLVSETVTVTAIASPGGAGGSPAVASPGGAGGSPAIIRPISTYAYDALGDLVQSKQVSTSGVWRAQSTTTHYSLAPDGSVWSRDFSISSCSDPAIAALTNRTDRMLAPLSQTERSHVVFYDLRGNATHETEAFDRATARRESVTMVPWADDLSRSISLAGRTVEVVDFASVTNRYAYDALGQRTSATDGRGNTTDFVYSHEGLLLSRTDAATNATHFVYDAAGRNIATIDALGHTTHVAYDAANRKIAEWGAVYPAVYAYDSYGRTIALATTRDTNFVLSAEAVPDLANPPEALDVTRWDYDEATGLLLDKRYADGKGPSYAYSPEGLLARRTWARGVTTDYVYDDFDSLVSKTYSDETPSVALRYDARGQLLKAICEGVSTNCYAYNQFGQITNELQNGTSLARSYDAFGRPTGYCIGNGLEEGSSVSYSYDANGRFSAVSSGTNTFSYSYLPGSSLVSGMTANTGHAWERIYEPNRDLITSVHNRYGDRTISRFDYVNDEIGRRIARVDSGEAFSDAAFERYFYNDRSELTGAQRFYGSDVTDESRPVPGRSFGYAYDPIGNRVSSTEERDGVPVVTLYESNELNQYTRTTNESSTVDFEYDEDGNTTFDGRFRYSWNAENRMIRAEEAVIPINRDQTIISYAYDGQGRMVAKTIDGTNHISRISIWDDYNIIRETINGTATHNVWGLDLSGTIHGCGGVGGLVSVEKANDKHIAFHDANGNVSAFLSETGVVSVHYEYSPYGTPLGLACPSSFFAHQFSTMPFCEETGLSEFPFRNLLTVLGRWTNRDAYGEAAGVGLFTYVSNSPHNGIDPDGHIEYNYRKNDCILQVKLRVRFRLHEGMNDGAMWSFSQAQEWRKQAKETVESYFNSITLKCFPNTPTCCECRDGVSLKLTIETADYFWNSADYYVHVYRTTFPGHRSWTNRYKTAMELDYSDLWYSSSAPGYSQKVIVHEFGHAFGLDHPGGQSNDVAAYDADPESLMGRGMTMRPSDFEKAFCNKIQSSDGNCQEWRAL